VRNTPRTTEWTQRLFRASFCALCILGGGEFVHAQLQHIKADVTPLVETNGAHAGDTVRTALAVKLPEGLHVQSNKPRDPLLIATELTIDAPVFQRTQAGNPVADYIYVYVPYCTGDIHTGTHVANYLVNGTNKPTYHYGGHNVDLFYPSLAASYPGLQRVLLAGVSAGGYGTFMSQDFAVRAFGGIRVDLYDDSGPPIENSTLFNAAIANWVPQFPSACSDCSMGFGRNFAYDRMTYPSSRFGFLTYQTDSVLPMFYGETPQMFATQIAAFLPTLASDPNEHYFELLSTGHGVSANFMAYGELLPWLTKMVTDDPTWANAMY